MPTNKVPKTAYEAQLEQIFGGAYAGCQSHDDSLEYSDVSEYTSDEDDDETDSDEDEVPNDTSTKDTDSVDNANVLEILKKFINSDEKVGPEISASLAKLVNSGLRATTSHDKVLELSKKYDKPGNVESARVNLGIWKQLTDRTKDIDVKLQKIQNLVAKSAVPLLYLLDLLMKKIRFTSEKIFRQSAVN